MALVLLNYTIIQVVQYVFMLIVYTGLQETNVETNVQQVTIAQEANITVVDEITAIKHCIESPFQKQCKSYQSLTAIK